MNNYTFYVYTNAGIKDDLSLNEAIKQYKQTKTGLEYKALGVTKDNEFACDLVNNLGKNSSDKISHDYKSMKNFKDDKLITVNTVKILEREFNLEG
jgi:hypothetical protein